MTDILEIIKRTALEAVNNSSPTSVLFGLVLSNSPLEIQVEQKLVLTKEFLILTKNVTDYDIDISVDWKTENKELNLEDINIDTSHNHSIVGTKKIIIHNALKKGDKVILLQQQGGQKFIVLDKIY